MKRALLSIVCTATVFLSSHVSGAPALVWQQPSNSETATTVHSSKATDLPSIVGPHEKAVVFVLGRDPDDGSESLTTLSAAGSLPGVMSMYPAACHMHHSVGDVTSPHMIARSINKARKSPGHAVDMSLDEYDKLVAGQTKEELEVSTTGMISKTAFKSKKRAQELEKAKIWIVRLDPAEAEKADEAVVSAMNTFDNVILTAARSVEEVKHERNLLSMHRVKQQEAAGKRRRSKRRRLEEEADEEDNNEEDEEEEEYVDELNFVSMTPNILAGILFFLLFTTVTWIGITCMGMISGQDVYVKKVPYIGREA